MMNEEQQTDAGPAGGGPAGLADDGKGRGNAGFEPASEAWHGLRATLDRAADGVRALRRAGAKHAQDAESRTSAIGRELRGQGERAVAGVARRVEQNPLASLAIAFALGCLCARVGRR